MRSELIFFISLIFIIIEQNIDLGLWMGFIVCGFIILDMALNKHPFRITKFSKYNTALKSYLMLIPLGIIETVLAVPINYSQFMVDGVKAFIANTILILLLIMYFIAYIDQSKFFQMTKKFGLMMAYLGVIETICKQYIFYPVFNKSLDMSTIHTNNFRTTLIFGHPAITAIFMLFVFIILFYFPCKKTILQYFGCIAITITIYGTKTRAMWITFVFLICIMLAEKCKNFVRKNYYVKKKKIYIFIIIGLVGIIVSVYLYPFISKQINVISGYLSLMFDRGNSYVSRVVRVGNIQNALKYVMTNPISILLGGGLGFGNAFSSQNGIVLSYGDVWKYGIDNQFVTLLLEFGVLGVVIYLISILYAFLAYFRTNDNESKMGSLFVVLIAFSSLSIDSFGWRTCTFILQIGLFLISSKKEVR